MANFNSHEPGGPHSCLLLLSGSQAIGPYGVKAAKPVCFGFNLIKTDIVKGMILMPQRDLQEY